MAIIIQNPMPTVKHPINSKTIWGLIILTLSILRERFGIVLSDDAISHLLSNIEVLAQIVGSILVVVGRFTAAAPLSLRADAINAAQADTQPSDDGVIEATIVDDFAPAEAEQPQRPAAPRPVTPPIPDPSSHAAKEDSL